MGTRVKARMPYRAEEPALEERRDRLWRELEEARKHAREMAASAAREKSLESELRAVEARLADRKATKSPLDDIKIASPCKASWDDMVGDERVRFCGKCAKNVYDLSAMDRAEAEALLAKNEGAMCVKLARRTDGTVITNDCPVGARKKRVRLAVLSTAGAGAIAAAALLSFQRTTTLGGLQPMPRTVMGEMEAVPNVPDPETPATPLRHSGSSIP